MRIRAQYQSDGIDTVPGLAAGRSIRPRSTAWKVVERDHQFPRGRGFALVAFSLALFCADGSELAIGCALNRVGGQTYIQRLCPNFVRRHAR